MLPTLLREVQLVVVLELDWLSTKALSTTSRHFHELCTSSWGSKLSYHLGYEVDGEDAEYLFRRFTTCGSPRCYNPYTRKYIPTLQRSDIVEFGAQGQVTWAITSKGQCIVQKTGALPFTMDDRGYTAIVELNESETLFAAALLTGELYVVRFRSKLDLKWVRRTKLDTRVAYFVYVTRNVVVYVSLDREVVRLEFKDTWVETTIVMNNVVDFYADDFTACFVKPTSWGTYRLCEREIESETKGTVQKYVPSEVDYFLSDEPVVGEYKVHISTHSTRTMTGTSDLTTIARLLHNGTLLIDDTMLDTNVITLYDHVASDYVCYIKQ
jgi:hypothetical protein